MKKLYSILLAVILLFSFSACTDEVIDIYSSENISSSISVSTTEKSSSNIVSKENSGVKLSDIPKYSGKAYVVLNNNKPNFNKSELTIKGYEKYGNLDSLNRCTTAIASIGIETMPKKGEKRGSISSIKPSGWVQARYDFISGKYLYNRCHLIGWQLSSENANAKNLITGTKYLNINGMLPFENMVDDYIEETGNHVAYRVTPHFKGNNLLASGVQIEAFSIEDQGDGICFNVYCYNVEPGVKINYKTGASSINSSTASKKVTTNTNSSSKYILNLNTKKFHIPSCSSVKLMSEKNKAESKESRQTIINKGYSPCGNCNP